MKISNISVSGKGILAPMAEYSNLPFRLLAKEFGASLVYTEMAMAKGIVEKDKEELYLLKTSPQEKPVIAQICGSSSEEMRDAARIVESLGFSGVDINFCCPINRIINKGAGAALLDSPEKIQEMIGMVVNAVKIPVTVKILSGINASKINAVEISKICEAKGAKAIAIHPRTLEQGYIGDADWPLIAQIKKSVSIPVIGSGDIRTPLHAKKMLEETGCDAVMIARGCLGQPWFFREFNHLVSSGSFPSKLSLSQMKQILLRHAKMLKEHTGGTKGIMLLRKHLSYYSKAMNKEEFGKAVRNIKTQKEFDDAVKNYL
ncbi:MAG: tRNA dihydrouridine synthase DusB [Candidatus Brocadiae bacterium]|nr:tRNA dihydrouridine synthase DusB [Candidatus Brocadiia bacterium]